MAKKGSIIRLEQTPESEVTALEMALPTLLDAAWQLARYGDVDVRFSNKSGETLTWQFGVNVPPRTRLQQQSFLLLRNNQDIANRATTLFQQQKVYPKGCSDFVCDVLSIPWESANSLMSLDSNTAPITNLSTVGPGSVVGWATPGSSGHVAIYVNAPDMRFIDVRNPGADSKPRKVNSYGTQKLYLSNRFGICS